MTFTQLRLHFVTKRPYFNGVILMVISLWSASAVESHAASPTRHCSVFGVAAPGTFLHSCSHPAGRLAFSLHHLGGTREERLSGRGHATPPPIPTFSWPPSVQPAVSRSSTVLPCGLRAQPTMWCCGAAGRGLVQLSHSSAADCQPGPARLGPARPGPSQPRTHLS